MSVTTTLAGIHQRLLMLYADGVLLLLLLPLSGLINSAQLSSDTDRLEESTVCVREREGDIDPRAAAAAAWSSVNVYLLT